MEPIEFGDLRLVPSPQGVLEKDVLVKFDPNKYGRRKRIVIHDRESTDESKINEFWQEKKKNSSRLFNQSKFRLACCQNKSNGKSTQPMVELKVGITDYKVNISMLPFMSLFIRSGKDMENIGGLK